jgi:hypothetical protein
MFDRSHDLIGLANDAATRKYPATTRRPCEVVWRPGGVPNGFEAAEHAPVRATNSRALVGGRMRRQQAVPILHPIGTLHQAVPP